MAFQLTINGRAREIDVEGDMPLLWVLRDEIGLTGTKFGCGIGACGACTVHINGEAIRSCQMPVSGVAGPITTIEGLGAGQADELHPVQKAWVAAQVPQCGYCQSGLIMAVASLLAKNPSPTDDDLKTTVTNICRCGTHDRVRAAVAALAKA